jgi:hypothetical protein
MLGSRAVHVDTLTELLLAARSNFLVVTAGSHSGNLIVGGDGPSSPAEGASLVKRCRQASDCVDGLIAEAIKVVTIVDTSTCAMETKPRRIWRG